MALVAGIAALAIRRMRKNKQGGCSCGCAGCGRDCPCKKKEE